MKVLRWLGKRVVWSGLLWALTGYVGVVPAIAGDTDGIVRVTKQDDEANHEQLNGTNGMAEQLSQSVEDQLGDVGAQAFGYLLNLQAAFCQLNNCRGESLVIDVVDDEAGVGRLRATLGDMSWVSRDVKGLVHWEQDGGSKWTWPSGKTVEVLVSDQIIEDETVSSFKPEEYESMGRESLEAAPRGIAVALRKRIEALKEVAMRYPGTLMHSTDVFNLLDGDGYLTDWAPPGWKWNKSTNELYQFKPKAEMTVARSDDYWISNTGIGVDPLTSFVLFGDPAIGERKGYCLMNAGCPNHREPEDGERADLW